MEIEELTVSAEHAYCRQVSLPDPIAPMLRVYRSSPAGLTIQVRAHCGIGETGKGKPRDMIAGVSIDRDDAMRLRLALDAFIGWGNTPAEAHNEERK